MADIQEEVRDKMRRTLTQEFTRMEDDYDDSRNQRKILVEKLMTDAQRVKLVTEDGAVGEDTDTGLRVITTALKALSDSEKAASSAILLKLKQNEQSIASSAMARDRIAIILKATAPGQLEESFPAEELENHLSEMFPEGTIKDYETKTNPRDLSD